MERERMPKFTIERMSADTVVEANEMRMQSWLDTYTNEEYSVTLEWIERRNNEARSPEKLQARLARLATNTTPAWVALGVDGRVIGCTTPYVTSGGVQRVGSLYVAKDYLGSGAGSALMQKVIDGFDSSRPIELGVVAYNERAKAFYRKWGFTEVPGSETLFDDLIPEVKMIRKGDNQNEV